MPTHREIQIYETLGLKIFPFVLTFIGFVLIAPWTQRFVNTDPVNAFYALIFAWGGISFIWETKYALPEQKDMQ